MMIRTIALHASLALLLGTPAGVVAHERAHSPVLGGALAPSARPAAAVVDAFHAALRRGDLQSAQALLAPNALIFEEGGSEHGRAEYASEHLPADAAFSKAVGSAITRRAGDASGAMAWVATEGRTTGEYRGRSIDQRTTETMVLRQTKAGWRIMHIHWSSAPFKQQ